MYDIISRQYPVEQRFAVRSIKQINNLTSLSEQQKNQIRILQGHLPFGTHRYLPHSQGTDYFTLLRSPVERVNSLYHFILEREGHYAHKEIVQNNYSLQDFVCSGLTKETDNGQLRLLGNKTNADYGSLKVDDLAFAKAKLKEHFTVVGLTERFDETVLLLKKQYQWKWTFYRRKNVTKSKITVSDLDESTVNSIIRYNELDIELYNWAAQRFEQHIASLGNKFEKELTGYRKLNRIFRQAARFSDLLR